jgi:hypothetical protein
VYSFRGEPGRRYDARLRSADFPTYVVLARTVGGITEPFAETNGVADGSRLRFSVPTAGEYLLIAQSVTDDGTGSFTLSLDTLPAPRPRIAELRVGDRVEGKVTEEDFELAFDGVVTRGNYDLYRLRGTPGQRLHVRMEGSTWRPTLSAGTLQDGRYVPEVFEHTKELHWEPSQMLLTIPASGEYLVQAAAQDGEFEAYTLEVEEDKEEEIGPSVAPVRIALSRGLPVDGRLEVGNPHYPDGRWYHEYSFTGRPGELVRVTLQSRAFDAHLLVGRMEEGEFREMRSEDNTCGSGTDAALDVEVPPDGVLVLIATSARPGGRGAYRIRVGPPQTE